jgi:hypothetical protein
MSDIVKRFREEQIDILHRHYYPTMHEQIADATLFKCLDELYNTKLDGRYVLGIVDLEECQHKLIKISKCVWDGAENEDIVAYWCERCGAIQKDIESDGRFIRHHKVHKPKEGYKKVVHMFGEGE